MFPPVIQKLIDLFSLFPTVGPRTAGRFVFYLLKLPKEEITKLISAISDLKYKIKLCEFCFNPFEPFDTAQGKGELCEICKDNGRDKTLLCIIEKESDLISLERTKKYKGRYFILSGTFFGSKKADAEKFTQLNSAGGNLIGLTQLNSAGGNLTGLTQLNSAGGNLTGLRIKELENRIKNQPEIQEIIIAINPTAEGEATALYLERALEPFEKKITRLGRGLPVGAELEYADEETLSSAFESRR